MWAPLRDEHLFSEKRLLIYRRRRCRRRTLARRALFVYKHTERLFNFETDSSALVPGHRSRWHIHDRFLIKFTECDNAGVRKNNNAKKKKKKEQEKSLHVRETVEMLCLIVLFILSGFLLARNKNLINQPGGVKVRGKNRIIYCIIIRKISAYHHGSGLATGSAAAESGRRVVL